MFLGKVTALGVLCCFALFVCLTLLASFFLPSHLSFKNMYNVYSCDIFYAARKINVAKFHNKKSRVMVVTDVAVSDGVCVVCV